METKLRSLIILLLILTMSPNIQAQDKSRQSSLQSGECSCSKALDEIIDKVTRIYAGFDDKVTSQTQYAYKEMVKNLRSKASSISSPQSCEKILQTYTKFFKDSHISSVWMGRTKNANVNTEVNINRTELVTFKRINDNFLYVKLAVFNQKEVERLDSLLIANRELLAKTPHLIMDLRGNGGGNTSTSDEMAKLIYTNPIVYPAWDYRSSAEFIKAKERDVRSEKDTTNPYFLRAVKLLKAAKENPGMMVQDSGDLIRTLNIDPNSYPQQIAFLIDKGSGSATEFYIFESKQSKKVTLFGTNSYGVMDYGSDQDFKICGGMYNLATPWGRNGWVRDFRIDNVGFKPDVRIPESEKDWVAFVQQYYLQKGSAKSK